MGIWGRSRGAMEERRVFIGGLVCAFIFSAALFANDKWKAGTFVALWAPPFFSLGDLLRERIERR